MTTTNTIPTEKALMSEPITITKHGFVKIVNSIYEDVCAVGYTVAEAEENYARVIKLTLAKFAPVWRREASRKEYQERRKNGRK